jgi:hypothetical protein
MRLVEAPTLFPAVTLYGDGGQCVDTECELVAGGRMYVSRTELAVMAPFFDFLSPEAAAQLRTRIATLEEELAVALSTIDRIRSDVLAVA